METQLPVTYDTEEIENLNDIRKKADANLGSKIVANLKRLMKWNGEPYEDIDRNDVFIVGFSLQVDGCTFNELVYEPGIRYIGLTNDDGMEKSLIDVPAEKLYELWVILKKMYQL